MILITVDIVPGGFQPLRRTIASMRIANVSNLADISDYRIDAMEAENRLADTPSRNCVCEITDHDRSQSIWALIERASRAAMEAQQDVL